MCAVLRCKSERVIAEEKNRLRPCDYPKVVRTAIVIASVADVCVKGKESVQYTYSLITSGSWLVSTLKEQ